AAATAPAVHTQATNGGVTRLGQRVTVQCRPLRPTDIVLVRLLRRPADRRPPMVEVFVSASGSRGALRPPWKSRRDATFLGLTSCLALTLDGAVGRGRVQLLTAMTPAEPRLFVNGKQTLPMASKKSSAKRRIELVEGQAIMIRCNANVGKPPAALSLLDLGRRAPPKRRRSELGLARDTGSKTMTGTNIISMRDRIDCLAKGRPAPKNPMDKNIDRRRAACRPRRCQSRFTMRTRVRRLTESGVIINRLLQSIGFHLHNRTIAAARTTAAPQPPAVGGPGVPTKVKALGAQPPPRHLRVPLITFGVICGFALIAVVFAYLYSTAFSSSTAYGRLRDNPEDRLRFYGDNGRGNGGAYCDTSDEEEGSL
uniref:Ig-like domain-containing protein n=1 Tax=Macrostomum lignano TaxID=282301 RepID=A0A1I8FBE6_9PLAT